MVPALACEALVWRLLRRKAWIDADTDLILPDAYLRRKDVDMDGLSVGIKGVCTLDEFKASLNKDGNAVLLQKLLRLIFVDFQ